MATSKRIKINSNVLLEWIYDDANVKTENYSVISNLVEGSRGYVSSTPLNTVNNTLFTVDSVLKRYSKVDFSKFNFLQKQDYAGYPITYDTLKIYLPIDYSFTLYQGFSVKIYSLDYTNTKLYNICNFFYDKALDANIGMIDLIVPFNFDQKLWGKCITLSIPSVYGISKDRSITSTQNITIPNTINNTLTNGVGLSQTSPIFIDFSYITAKDNVLGTDYYTIGDIYEVSVPQQPEYQSLGVEIVESTQGDFFDIYGIYQGTNEMLDNFVADLEANGMKIEIEYTITLYEEGIQSGYPQTFVVTENFAQKISYRPIIKFSNTTAAIDVLMTIHDLVNNSQIERFASIGLTKNIGKYGKTLSRINLDDSVTKPKIYNAAPDTIVVGGNANVTEVKANITKVPYPVLLDKYKILVNSTNSVNNEYKSNGLLSIIITPFDTVIKFTIAKNVDEATGISNPYDLSEIVSNSNIKLVFKYGGKQLEKEYYAQASDNNFKLGVIVFKINESDLNIIKEIYSKGSKNFYITISSSVANTLLYSGKYEFYENIKFIDLKTQNTDLITQNTTLESQVESLTNTVTQLEIDKKTLENSQFNIKNIPYGIPEDLIKDNKNYFNVLLYLKKYYSPAQFDVDLNSLGITAWIYYDYVYYIGGLNITLIREIESRYSNAISNITRIDIYDGQNVESKVFTIPPSTTTTTTPNTSTTPTVVKPKPTCFTPDSLVVMADNTVKKIKNIIEGDIVMSIDIPNLPANEKLLGSWNSDSVLQINSKSVVNQVFKHSTINGYCDINNGLLNVTDEHMIFVYTNSKYVFLPAASIKVGDMLINTNGDHTAVTSNIHVDYCGDVYNLSLSTNYVYYVNGILVHNKKKNFIERDTEIF